MLRRAVAASSAPMRSADGARSTAPTRKTPLTLHEDENASGLASSNATIT
jgi:hypothetical protein